MDVYGCDEVVVSELTAEGASYGVRWTGAGEGAWSRVDMIGDRGLVPPPAASGLTAGWVDECYGMLGFSTAESKQIVSDSRAIATGPGGQGYGYTSDCAETYFFGGQIASTMTGTGVHAGLGVGGFDFGRAVPPRFFSFGTQILPAGRHERANSTGRAPTAERSLDPPPGWERAGDRDPDGPGDRQRHRPAHGERRSHRALRHAGRRHHHGRNRNRGFERMREAVSALGRGGCLRGFAYFTSGGPGAEVAALSERCQPRGYRRIGDGWYLFVD
jgi:hypothetical protein